MKTIATALAKAQAEMSNALKDKENPHFRSKYADLASVRDACLPALNKHGISVYSEWRPGETPHLATVFLHESGEKIDTEVPILLGKRDMQGLGSAITYARRYGLMMLAGIAPDDDDGNAAAATGEAKDADFSQKGLAEAWEAGVLDGLPDDPSAETLAEAYIETMLDDLTKYRSSGGIDGYLKRHMSHLRFAEEHAPEAYGRLKDAVSEMRKLTANQGGKAA